MFHCLRAPLLITVIAAIYNVFGIASVSADDKTPLNFTWPNNAKAAVSLQYDDATSSQLDNVLPSLNKLGLRASFAVSLNSLSFHQRTDEWTKVPSYGHELANHTLFHQCAKTPDRTWLSDWHDLNQIAAGQMRDEILLANTILSSYDGKKERTFTVPCGDFLAKGESYLPLIQQYFLGMKTHGGPPATSMENFDRMNVTSLVPHNAKAEQLIAYVEQAKTNGTMASIIFHGVGGDHLAVDTKEHEKFLNYLAEHQEVYWVDTFANIMRHVRDQKSSASKNQK